MKILFITDLYPIKQGENNTPLTLHNFVIEWIKQGHEVDVIKPNFIFNSFLRKKPFYPRGFYQHEGVKIFNMNYFTPFCFDFLKKVPKEIDLRSYDVVIAHMPSGIIFANKLAKRIQKPLVCSVHSSDLEIVTNPIYKFYFKGQLKNAYKNSKKIACRSFVLQKKFNNLFPELAHKTFVAASGVSVGEQETVNGKRKMYEATGREEQETGMDGENLPFTAHSSQLTLLTCANLIKRKNIDKLILAMRDLKGFELKIIGDGPELKKLIRRVGLPSHQDNIKFLGRLANEKVLEEMKNSDIFILPSVNETFGMVYLEAMASGCITVCTKNDGIDGIIKDSENGFLCKPTAEGIKEVLLKIKDFDNLEEIQKNSLKTVQNYTPEVCAKNYLENLF